ncbi:MAG: hypothetical protein KAR42_03635 [candidate division Zixibacteria bacterium]|nr:hypothetical protein [candidate division Zixibacteria bacterium]
MELSKKFIILLLLSLFSIGLSSCSYIKTREFLCHYENRLDGCFGWYFKPDMFAYRYKSDKGIADRANIFYFDLTAILPNHYSGPLLGIDIDTVYMKLASQENVHVWHCYESLYAKTYKEDFKNWFLMVSTPTLDTLINLGVDSTVFIYIPPEVDTVFLEFDAKFYPGYIKEYYEDSSTWPLDSIAFPIQGKKQIVKHINLILIRNEYRTLTIF